MIVAIVPARSGSKGFPDKNIAEIHGKTLIQYAVEAGLDSMIDEVYISTDSEKYEEIAIASGAKSLGLRSAELAGDDVRTADVIIDFIERYEGDIDLIVLLQPTVPQRQKGQIDVMIRQMEKSGADACVSVSRVDEPHPYKLLTLNDNKLEPFIKGELTDVPRQGLPDVYRPTGAVYIIAPDALKNEQTFIPLNTCAYVSSCVVNIDSKDDFEYLQFLIERGRAQI